MNILRFIYQIRVSYVLFLIVFLSHSCTKIDVTDLNIKEPITVQTSAVEILGIKQLRLSGRIEKFNSENIIDVGFLIYDNSTEPNSPIEIIVPNTSFSEKNTEYSLVYNSMASFNINTLFAYCFFVRTNKAIYKGEVLPFRVDLIKTTAQGIVNWKLGQPLALSGDFAQMDDNYFVEATFDNKKLSRVDYEISKDKKLLTLRIPAEDLEHGQVLDLHLNYKSKNSSTIFTRKFIDVQVEGKVNEPVQSLYYYNDLLPIEGVGIPKWNSDKLRIIINGVAKSYNRELRFSDFGAYANTTFKWAVDYGNGIVEFKNAISFKKPSADNLKIANSLIHTGQNIILTGINFKKYYNNILDISLNNTKVDFKVIDDSVLSVNTSNLPQGDYSIVLRSSLYNVESSNKLKIKTPNVTGVSSSTLFVNDELRILGDFIVGQNYFVSFIEGGSSWTTATSPKELKIIVPNIVEQTYSLLVYWQNYDGNIFEMKTKPSVMIKDAEVFEISPKSFAPGETIIVRGNGLFDVEGIFLGNYTISAKSVSQNMLTFQVPYNFAAGKYKVSFSRNLRRDLLTEQIIEIR